MKGEHPASHMMPRRHADHVLSSHDHLFWIIAFTDRLDREAFEVKSAWMFLPTQEVQEYVSSFTTSDLVVLEGIHVARCFRLRSSEEQALVKITYCNIVKSCVLSHDFLELSHLIFQLNICKSSSLTTNLVFSKVSWLLKFKS